MMKLYYSSSSWWMQRHVRDQYVKKAVKQNLRSRSAFKLMQIDDKYKIFNNSMPTIVIDCGCAPGGWLLVAKNRLEKCPKSLFFGIDLLPIEPIDKCTVFKGDFTDENNQLALLDSIMQATTASTHTFYTNQLVLLSDLSPAISGNHDADHLKSLALAKSVFNFYLKIVTNSTLCIQNSLLLCKYFRGAEEQQFRNFLSQNFAQSKIIKPEASRQSSSEMYFLGGNKKTFIS